MPRRDDAVTAIAEGIWHVHAPGHTLPPYRGTECYWIGRRERVWLVDTGDGGPAAQAALEAAWRALGEPRVEGVLVTHLHRDHRGGAAWAAQRFQAPIYLGAEDLALLDPGDRIAWQPIAAGTASLGGIAVDIVHAPGHTPGQMNIWIPAAGLLLAGDNVLGATTAAVSPPHGDLRVYQATLRRLLALQPARIGPGHGPLVEDGSDRLRYYLAHRQEREAQILARLAAGPASVADLADALYRQQLPVSRRAVGERMVRAHLEPLLREGRVRQGASDVYILNQP